MRNMKKKVLATAVLMVMGTSAAEAVVSSFTYTGSFLMYDGTDPANLANFPATFYAGSLNSGAFLAANSIMNPGGHPISGTMDLNFDTGAGTSTIVPSMAFFGSDWTATVTSMTRGYTSGTTTFDLLDWDTGVWSPGGSATDTAGVNYFPVNPATNWHTTIVFAWGAPAATSCGMINCGINVAVDLDIQPAGGDNYTFATVGSWMFDGPFSGAQPTFSGTLTAVPVPATAWMVGSGLLGLLGVGRARRKTPFIT